MEHLATASGTLGACADYLLQTIEGLTQAGIEDQSLLHLQQQVLAQQQSTILQGTPRSPSDTLGLLPA